MTASLVLAACDDGGGRNETTFGGGSNGLESAGDSNSNPGNTAGETGTIVDPTGVPGDDTNATNVSAGATTGMSGDSMGFNTTLTTAPPDFVPDPTNTTGDAATGTIVQAYQPEDVIDDLEDADAVIYETADGRIGIWYVYNDATAGGTQSPAVGEPFLPSVGGPNGSMWHAHTQGSGFPSYAGIGFDLSNTGSLIKEPYNASAFSGIVFQARGSGDIRFTVLSEADVPTTSGGTCQESSGQCYVGNAVRITLTDAWTQHAVPWSMLVESPFPIAPGALMSLQWQAPQGGTFEIAIDDVAFY